MNSPDCFTPNVSTISASLSVNVPFKVPAPQLVGYYADMYADIHRYDENFLCDNKVSRITPTFSYFPELQVQGFDIFADVNCFLGGFKHFREYVGQKMSVGDTEFIAKLGEDICLLLYHLVKADSLVSYTLAIVNFVKLRYNTSICVNHVVQKLLTKFKSLFDTSVQGAEDVFLSIRKYLNNYEELRNAPIFKKLYKFFMYVLSMNLFKFIGVTFDTFKYTKLETAAIRSKFYAGPDFVHSMIDTIIFLCERGYQCMKTGSMDPIYHNGGKYEEWIVKASAIKAKSVLLTNPEPHGIDVYAFLSDLNDLIEQGDAMYKHALRLGDVEKKAIAAVLAELVFIKNMRVTKRAAQQSRKAPFSVLVEGPSCMGKSAITAIMFDYFAKLKGLRPDAEFMYTRNFTDEFWSGFNSAQWCVILDDIAFLHPNVAKAGDPSLMEVIQVINSVPFVPNQADLPDKGKTPMKAQLVIGTTNTLHLNAYAYFACPLAVRRRFPYVVRVTVKKAYRKDGFMLDSTKVPQLLVGDYPDFWDFTIMRIVPGGSGCNSATTEFVQSITNIYEYLDWFRAMSDKHDASQGKVEESTAMMRSVKLCKCFRPVAHCICMSPQVEDRNIFHGELELPRLIEEEPSREIIQRDIMERVQRMRTRAIEEGVLRETFVHEDIIDLVDSMVEAELMGDLSRSMDMINYIDDIQEHFEDFSNSVPISFFSRAYFKKLYIYSFHFGTYVYLESKLFRKSANWWYSFPIMREYWHRWMLTPITKSYFTRKVFNRAGRNVQSTIGSVPFVLAFPVIILGFFSFYKLLKRCFGSVPVVKHTVDRRYVDSDCESLPDIDDLDEQDCNIRGRPPKPIGIEKENVWHKPDIVLSHFDVPTISMDVQALISKVRSNCVSYALHVSELHLKYGRAFCIGGQLYVTNNHSVPEANQYIFDLVFLGTTIGVSRNMTITLSNSDLFRITESDLVFLRIPYLPPRPNLFKFLCGEQILGNFRGDYVSVKTDGSPFNLKVENINLLQVSNEILDTNILSWVGRVSFPTVNGDCGSVLVVDSSFGAIIFGIHYLGGSDVVAASRITQSVAKLAIDYFQKPIFEPHAPLLSAPSAEKVLGSLHPKSIITFSPQGVGETYGTILGPIFMPKSNVCPTFISEEIQSRGYVSRTVPPPMGGWEPWYKPMQDIFNPIMGLKTEIVYAATNSYIHDILSKLSEEQLAQVFVYDDNTAINGAPGVQYVDKINRNTSAGAPWNKGKKYFMCVEPGYKGLDLPVVVNDEIMSRVRECEKRYRRGERYMPIFTGHLKDEPISQKKALLKKVRLFMGGPFCWTIVVRKFTLSLTKLIQSNRFLFESAPGTVAQSLEWEQIYDHLVKFGDDTIVAGDYARFDKQMSPLVTMEAFRVLIAIVTKAGWCQDDIMVLHGIAWDTCFPIANVRNDLYQLYGSNPSGHPLTVIINGLVNCIYMRYCFILLSPKGDCNTFKRYVSLITYGDDNAMGVHKDAPWFNHTAIQGVLKDAGIVYTMADKEAPSVPYISIRECSFLKRTWRFDNDVNAFLCPLEHESIEKMLTMCVRSKTITSQAQAIAVISTALREYFFYGKDIFEEKSILLREVARVCDLDLYVEKSTFPSWRELNEDFWSSSKHLSVKRLEVDRGDI
nr:MAG: RNA dependent RNA polymerase [Picornaviridae sp.]